MTKRLRGFGIGVAVLGLLAAVVGTGQAAPSASAAPDRGLQDAVKRPPKKQARAMKQVARDYSGIEVCGARVSTKRAEGLRWGMVRANFCPEGTVFILTKRRGGSWRWHESLGSDWGAPGSCRGKDVPARVLRDLTGDRCVGGTPTR